MRYCVCFSHIILIITSWIKSTTAEKSVCEREVEDLRQKCEKGCEEVEELRQKLEEVICARDKLQEEVGFLDLERKTEQQEVSRMILSLVFSVVPGAHCGGNDSSKGGSSWLIWYGGGSASYADINCHGNGGLVVPEDHPCREAEAT